MKLIYVFFIILLCGICVNSCSLQPRSYSDSRIFMGTVWDITLFDVERSHAYLIVQDCFLEVGRIADLLNPNDNQSVIAQVNAGSGKARVVVSPEIFSLINICKMNSKNTCGVFDVTVGALLDIWKRALKDLVLPSQKQLQQVRNLVGYEHIDLNSDDSSVFLVKENMKLDFGAVAKGYAIDQIVKLLRKNNVDQALINAGGNVYVVGKRTSNWNIGVQHPFEKNKIYSAISVEGDVAIATSGSYERNYHFNKKVYSHIIDPRSGYLLDQTHKVGSVTVVADNALEADVLSTTLYILGPDYLESIVKKYSSVKKIYFLMKDSMNVNGVKEIEFTNEGRIS